MTVEKTDDPAGLLPSKIHIKFDGGKNDLAALKSCLMAIPQGLALKNLSAPQVSSVLITRYF
jgi:hypothetical protein